MQGRDSNFTCPRSRLFFSKPYCGDFMSQPHLQSRRLFKVDKTLYWNTLNVTSRLARMYRGPPGGGGGFFDELIRAGKTLANPKMRFRRDVVEDVKEMPHKVEEEFKHLEKEAEDLVAPAAEPLGMEPW